MGTSWLLAFGNLQQAIDSADAGDEIWVMEGTYFPTRAIDGNDDLSLEEREKTFYISEEVKLLGGFEGTESDVSTRNWLENQTVLSGNLGDQNDSLDNAYHVLWIDGSSSPISEDCIIDGFTIEKGKADGLGIHESGAALYNFGIGGEASPLIINCLIRENESNYGGSLYNSGKEGISSPSIQSCKFIDNKGSNGSAMFSNGYMGVSNPVVVDCLFERNIATHSGGAIFLFANQGTSGLSIRNCIFKDNEGELGGAIGAFEASGLSSSNIVNCLFLGNEASRYGGALYHSGESNFSSYILNCTFSENTTGMLGGAIKNFNAECEAINSIFWNNQDEIVNNMQSQTTLRNCIYDDGVPNNVVSLPFGITNEGSVIDLDPSFISASENTRLRQNSPAIDAGTVDTAGLLLPLVDLDLQARVNGLVDIGSFENPFVNCPKQIYMQKSYGPLTGIYRAQDRIEVETGVSFDSEVEISLHAPCVVMQDLVDVQEGTTLAVAQDGCQP